MESMKNALKQIEQTEKESKYNNSLKTQFGTAIDNLLNQVGFNKSEKIELMSSNHKKLITGIVLTGALINKEKINAEIEKTAQEQQEKEVLIE